MYKVHARQDYTNAVFSVVESGSRLQAVLLSRTAQPLDVTPGGVATFLSDVHGAGYTVSRHRRGGAAWVRFGLLCWRVDVVPAGKKWPTSRGK